MEKFVHRENIKLYRKLLAETTDAQKRQMLLKLLADKRQRTSGHPKRTGADARHLPADRQFSQHLIERLLDAKNKRGFVRERLVVLVNQHRSIHFEHNEIS
jgi:hypothetical protein